MGPGWGSAQVTNIGEEGVGFYTCQVADFGGVGVGNWLPRRSRIFMQPRCRIKSLGIRACEQYIRQPCRFARYRFQRRGSLPRLSSVHGEAVHADHSSIRGAACLDQYRHRQGYLPSRLALIRGARIAFGPCRARVRICRPKFGRDDVEGPRV